MNSNQHSYKINGVDVMFPCKPYPSQFSMMYKIIQGLISSRNSLLESPTGSGKSLALLCSCLAWQVYQKAKFEEALLAEQHLAETETAAFIKEDQFAKQYLADSEATALAKEAQLAEQCPDEVTLPGSTSDKSSQVKNPILVVGDEITKNACMPLSSTEPDTSTYIRHDDDFKPNNKNFRNSNLQKEIADYAKSCDKTRTTTPGTSNNVFLKAESTENGSVFENKIPRVPKILFGTRTHKQVTQIVRELGKTAYKDARMAILASREFSCIHPEISRSSNKNDRCQELIQPPYTSGTCRFYHNVGKLRTQAQLKEHCKFQTAWDIEDLVTLGKTIKVCPYYATRSLKDEADIIFCPYNYLIDPVIRSSMMISVTGQIVVLDEAHNIEDSAREAASMSVNQEQLSAASKELKSIADSGHRPHAHRTMAQMCTALSDWIQQNSANLEQKDFNTSSRAWKGAEITAVLRSLNLGPDDLDHLKSEFEAVAEPPDPQTDSEDTMRCSTSVVMTLRSILLVINFMYKENLKYMDDYRCAIVKTASRSHLPVEADEFGWLRKNRNRPSHNFTFTLNFWCFNPAVAFSDFKDCYSIVLTSGTLSPMSSFQSELGLSFPIQLEANHVIHKSQVWVGTIGHSPSGFSLNATYRNAETFVFQDELGKLLLSICKIVPHGILCFFPSYSLMEKLVQRWHQTGIWEKMAQKKVMMSEPRASEKVNFEDLMSQFYNIIRETAGKRSQEGYDGVLLLAVCRGKVSEGLDFADNNARAVITVGIPFPNIYDTQVGLKRKYNDEHYKSRGLLSGSEWYDIQAYRALNQALGRCIRHRNDWGAIILVDDRYTKNPIKYTSGLSKWVRHRVQAFPSFLECSDSLSYFVQQQKEREGQLLSEESNLSKSNVTMFGSPTTPSTNQLETLVCLTSPKTPCVSSLLTPKQLDMPTSNVFLPDMATREVMVLPQPILPNPVVSQGIFKAKSVPQVFVENKKIFDLTSNGSKTVVDCSTPISHASSLVLLARQAPPPVLELSPDSTPAENAARQSNEVLLTNKAKFTLKILVGDAHQSQPNSDVNETIASHENVLKVIPESPTNFNENVSNNDEIEQQITKSTSELHLKTPLKRNMDAAGQNVTPDLFECAKCKNSHTLAEERDAKIIKRDLSCKLDLCTELKRPAAGAEKLDGNGNDKPRGNETDNTPAKLEQNSSTYESSGKNRRSISLSKRRRSSCYTQVKSELPCCETSEEVIVSNSHKTTSINAPMISAEIDSNHTVVCNNTAVHDKSKKPEIFLCKDNTESTTSFSLSTTEGERPLDKTCIMMDQEDNTLVLRRSTRVRKRKDSLCHSNKKRMCSNVSKSESTGLRCSHCSAVMSEKMPEVIRKASIPGTSGNTEGSVIHMKDILPNVMSAFQYAVNSACQSASLNTYLQRDTGQIFEVMACQNCATAVGLRYLGILHQKVDDTTDTTTTKNSSFSEGELFLISSEIQL